MPAFDPYPDLKQHLADGEACAFVGAGLSMGAGLPGWYDLLAELCPRIGYDLPPRQWATGDALIDAAQAYINRMGAHSLLSFLKERLDTTHTQPTDAHRALARLPLSLVFTANFDDLLERALREAGKRVEVIVRDSSIPFLRRGPDAVNIVKLYGDLGQPDTVVLARQQYDGFFLQRPQMVKLLETTLASTDTLYLGWSGSDPIFKLVFGELQARFGGMMRPGYAVQFDISDAQRDDLRRQQIHLVELPPGDRPAQLAGWLESLAPAAQDETPAPAPPYPSTAKGEGSPAAAVRPVLNSGKAWAVLVGINHHEDAPHIPDLRVCVADVTAVHAALAPSYTASRLLTDDTAPRLPTRANILSELNSAAQAAEAGDLLLFYFSGHGVAFQGESYLLPRDARLAALRHTAVAMRDVREIVEASPARAKVLLLDACHAGAAIGKAGPAMTPEFIQRVFTEAEGMAVLASCKQGQQSWEWRREGRSVFTHYLLEALAGAADFDGKGFVTVSDASRYVVDRVKLWAVEHSRPQTPALQYTVAGDIVLVRTGAVTADRVPPKPVSPAGAPQEKAPLQAAMSLDHLRAAIADQKFREIEAPDWLDLVALKSIMLGQVPRVVAVTVIDPSAGASTSLEDTFKRFVTWSKDVLGDRGFAALIFAHPAPSSELIDTILKLGRGRVGYNPFTSHYVQPWVYDSTNRKYWFWEALQGIQSTDKFK